jgi:ABC-2 type transport system ATP-binding protein
MTDHPSGAPALSAENLSLSYGSVRALDSLDLVAEHGAVTAILGPNGAGKTTAVSCATGLLRPDAGSVRVLGADPWRAGAPHRARVGVMVQDGGLTSGAKAMQLLRYGASLHAQPLDVDQVADHLGIDEFAGTLVRRLSGGQRQRLALGLAIIGRPELVFLDEPTAGMDPGIRRRVRHLIRSLADTGTAVVLTTHLMDDVVGLADAVCVVDRGRALTQGTVQEVISAHRRAQGTQSVHARFSGIAPGTAEAIEADLRSLAARHGAQLELSAGGAADLENVLLDLMDETGETDGTDGAPELAHVEQPGRPEQTEQETARR